ncbi:MAG: ATPase [Phycisphaerales bacterium]|nr:ATPase [Phycisphaerales bacterium]
MATAEQLKALVKSYTAGDDDRFRSVALQIAAHAARSGQSRLADDLQSLVDKSPRARGPGERDAHLPPVPITRPAGDLAGLVVASYPKVRLPDMVLAADTRSRLDRTLREYRAGDTLRSRGLRPRRKLLLAGPPGCGKTMTAAALAGELGLPLLSVQLHALITKFMGETAAKLHLIFDAMARSRGVYLFDEFDAIGAQRGSQHDVGEIRRVLNSFLQFLEQDNSDSLVVAATNLQGMLDEALYRRFDDVLQYERPDAAMVVQLAKNRLSLFDTTKVSWPKVGAAAKGLSHADVVRACEDAAKDAVLAGQEGVRTSDLARTLEERPRSRGTPKGRPRKRKSDDGQVPPLDD